MQINNPQSEYYVKWWGCQAEKKVWRYL